MTVQHDVISLLLEDHEEAKKLLSAVERNTGKARQGAFQQLVYALARHETAEEEVVYPTLRTIDDAAGAVADARIKEEEEANRLLADLEKLDVDSTEFGAKFGQLQKAVEAHADAEERLVFPLVRRARSEGDLEKLGKVLELAKATAPTHPHPNVPGTATANLVAGPLAAVIDRARDAIRDAREKLAS
jgi:hemerythrin superfamily protein